MRMLLTVVVGAGTFLLALIALGAVGLHAAHFQIPIALFATAMALWPVLKPVTKDTFKDYVGYQGAVMVVTMIVIYAVDKYLDARALLHSLQ